MWTIALLLTNSQLYTNSIFNNIMRNAVMSVASINTTTRDKLEVIFQEADKLSISRGGWSVADGLRHLVTADFRFANIISATGIPEAYGGSSSQALSKISDPYHSLLKIIIYQQLSAKSAEPIFKRFLTTISTDKDEMAKPELVNKAVFETIYVDGKKKIVVNGIVSGLSESKANYIKDLTGHFLDPNRLYGVDLTKLDDEVLTEKLLAVKGLGLWSVHMFMIFDLHRSNVLPTGDLGVRKGLALFYGYEGKYFEKKKNLEQMKELCAAWEPYCSLATCYMWAMLTAPAGITSDVTSIVSTDNVTKKSTSRAISKDSLETDVSTTTAKSKKRKTRNE